MSLPDLLRRLSASARYGDKAGVKMLSAQLAAHSGWATTVAAYIAALPSAESDFVRDALDPGPEDYHGGSSSLLYLRSMEGPSDPMATVTKDSTSNIYVPSSSAEWASTLTGISTAGGPNWLWLLQESSGSLADSIGPATLTNLNSMSYQSAVTGWTRKAMSNGIDGADVSLVNTTDTTLPDLSAESSLVLIYAQIVSAPAAERALILSGDVTDNITATNVPKIVNGANNGTGLSSVTTAVRPWVLRHNKTASTTTLFTDLEKVSATFGASGATKRIFFGSGLLLAPVWKLLYAVAFKGSAAELSDSQLKTLLQRLNWTIPW